LGLNGVFASFGLAVAAGVDSQRIKKMRQNGRGENRIPIEDQLGTQGAACRRYIIVFSE
jgi:hypothetical protein